MRTRLIALSLAALTLFTTRAHATFSHQWSHRYVSTDDQWIERMVVDPFGNLVAVGQYYGNLTLDGTHASTGDRDAFIAKFDANGSPLWVRYLGDVLADRAVSVAVDYVGNVICVGFLHPTPNDYDGFVVKYAPDGTFRWQKRFTTGDGKTQQVTAVSTDLSKNIIIAGEFDGTIDLGGGPLTEVGGRDLFMAKFDQGGNHIWSKRFAASTPFANNLGDLVTGPDGRSFLSGAIYDTVDLGNGTMTTSGGADCYLAKFDVNGGLLWAHQYGDAGEQYVGTLALSESGRLAMTGAESGTVNFGGGNLTATGILNPLIAVFTSGGSHVWSKIFTSAGVQSVNSLTWASNQDLLLVCGGSGTLNFGGGPLTIPGPEDNVWIARFFGASGNHRWSGTMVGQGVEGQVGENDGKVYMGGSVMGTFNFGGGETTGETDFLDIYFAAFSDLLTGVSSPLSSARLEQNVPNPFNPQTTIGYTLDSTARAQIGIYDASGSIIAILDDGVQPAGAHSMTWDGRDRGGKRVASGVYFYRLEGMPGDARKMVLLK